MSTITQQPGLYPSVPLSNFPEKGHTEEGLACLERMDKIHVRQKLELCEALTGWEQKNKYQICDPVGQELFFMREETSCCARQCCGPQRPFNMFVTDNRGQEVLQFKRDCVCTPCGWPNCFCCLCPLACGDQYQTLTVTSFGVELGTVSLESTCMVPTLTVKDSQGDLVVTLTSKFWQCSCGDEIEYNILSPEGEQVGNIVKEYNGFCAEVFTDADKYVLNFPVGLDRNKKALLLAAALHIDFLFYETKSNDN